MKPWKVQKLFGDVVYDLRSRGLLPVVGLLLVAMVAVPVLVSRGGGSSSSSPSLQAASASIQPAPEGERAVIAYSPSGVRNYKQRLNDQSAKDPFRQQFQVPESSAAASQLNSTVPVTGGGSTSVPTSVSPSTSTSTSSDGGSSGGGSSDGGSKKKKKVTVTYQVNVLAGDIESTLTPFNAVTSMTPLPSQTTPVVLFYGLTSDHKQALFLVSNKVAGVSGPGACVPAPDDCALLTVGPGQAEDLLYNGDGKTYRIVVAAIKSVKK
jgi:hypothetical protein